MCSYNHIRQIRYFFIFFMGLPLLFYLEGFFIHKVILHITVISGEKLLFLKHFTRWCYMKSLSEVWFHLLFPSHEVTKIVTRWCIKPESHDETNFVWSLIFNQVWKNWWRWDLNLWPPVLKHCELDHRTTLACNFVSFIYFFFFFFFFFLVSLSEWVADLASNQ